MELIERAKNISQNAYAPYSHYHVGAAVLSVTGEVFVGANVENASYGGTICAERSALVAAASAGHRKISAIAVHTPNQGFPCGICLQFISEFSDPHQPTEIIVPTQSGYEVCTINELVPKLWRGTK